jgi:hypothetical protein
VGVAGAASLALAGGKREATKRPNAASWCADRCDAVITE